MAPNSSAMKRGESKFVHDIHNIAVNAIYTHVTDKKGIKKHDERSISAMYKYKNQIDYIKVMRSLDPDSITKS